MNTLQAFTVQLTVIFIQQFYTVIPVYCKGNYNKCVTKGVLLLLLLLLQQQQQQQQQVTVYFVYSDFTCNINHNVYYTVTTIG